MTSLYHVVLLIFLLFTKLFHLSRDVSILITRFLPQLSEENHIEFMIYTALRSVFHCFCNILVGRLIYASVKGSQDG